MSMTALKQRFGEVTGGVYLVMGDATPLVEQAVEEVRTALAPTLGPRGLNSVTLRATEGDASQALVAARTLPMLGSHRLVVVLEAGQASPDFWSAALDYAQDPSPSSVLVLVATKLPKAQKGKPNLGVRLKNALQKQNAVFQFQTKDADPRAFASAVAKEQGKSLGRHAATTLVELVGLDLGVLAQEVRKVCLYVDHAAEVTAEDVEACVAALADAEVWDLTTGLALRDANLALAALHRLSNHGEDPRRLMSMVVWQYRSLLTADAMILRGMHDSDVQKAVRMRWNVFRAVRPRLGTGALQGAALLDRMSAASLAMNRYKAGAERVLERVVLDLLEPIRTPGP